MRLLFQQEAFGSRDGAVQEMHGGEPEESQSSIPEDGENMSEVKVKVPNGMLKAVEDRYGDVYASGFYRKVVTADLEAALNWLSENPIVPTAADALTLLQERVASGHLSNKEYCAIPATTIRCVIREWQRRMFLAPEPEGPEVPEVPEEVKDLMDILGTKCSYMTYLSIIEAYRRGQKSVSGAS